MNISLVNYVVIKEEGNYILVSLINEYTPVALMFT